MRSDHSGVNRREFLKQTALLGAGFLSTASFPRISYSASVDRLTILTSVSLSSLHPYAYSSSPEYGIWNHMAESLVEVDYEKMGYAGVLAESWEFQGKRWVFNLRKGVRFHDGSPFTVKDVIHSYQRLLGDKKSPQRYALSDIAEMTAADDHTLILTTKQPTAMMVERLNNRNILSKTAADKYGSDVDQHPTGTGPYRFVSWQRDGQLVLTRNDDYWRGKAAIKEILTRKVPVEEIARIEKNPQTRIERAQGQHMYFLALSPIFKPFDNKLVRQAYNYAIDPSVIIKHVYEGNGYVMDGPVASNVIGADPKIKRYPLDTVKAKELLAKAGYPNGVDVKLYLA